MEWTKGGRKRVRGKKKGRKGKEIKGGNNKVGRKEERTEAKEEVRKEGRD